MRDESLAPCRDCVREAIKREKIDLAEVDRQVLGTQEEKVTMV
jgi:hypothetical protein